MSGWLEPMVSAAFVAGLMGGAHCAAMCGGIAGMICSPGSGSGKMASGWRYALAYNGGRIFSYTVAGALAGALGQGGIWLRGGAFLQHALMFFAGAMLLVLALYTAGVAPRARGLEAAGGIVWRRVQPYSRHFLPVDTVPRALGLGTVWGWLPCGMVYAVLLVALATADAY
ncbi:MAG: sulfite exporter TauE/SafE family protein, partial [Burkholderiales bacterium]|nr:sulfite exporter TauE/SafE family protein [Burkholderiales bacterium]